MADAIAPKGMNTVLKGTLIPSYSDVAYGLGYTGVGDAEYPNFSDGYGGVEWRNAVEIGATANGSQNSNVSYAIYSTRGKQGYGGTDTSVVWGLTTDTNVSDNLIYLVNHLPQMSPIAPHTTLLDAMQWLTTEGYFIANRNYPRIGFTNTPMAFAFDPTFMASYPWVYTAIWDLVGSASTPGYLNGNVTPTVDTSNGQTPYLSVTQIGSNGYIELPDDVVSKLGGSADYIITNLWFKINNPGNYILLQVQDQSITDLYWLAAKVTSSGDLLIKADPRCSNDPGNIGFIKVKDGITSGQFYCLTINLNLVNDELQVWCTAASDPSVSSPSTQPYTYGGIGASVCNNPGASSLGASISGTFGSTTYQSQGAEAAFGSLHFYLGISPNYFSEDMAQMIFSETKAIYA